MARLGEEMRGMLKGRRRFVARLGAAVGALVAGPASAASVTPRATEGPYYPQPSMRFADVDNDLVKVAGMVQQAGGEIVVLAGTLTSEAGQPKADHRIEIWQCDVNGKYMHPGDRNTVPQDMGFQGFGHDITDAQGRYRFRTIKPVSYPGRTPHIHVKVFEPDGREVLTSQFYLAGHPENRRDRIFNALSPAQAARVSMVFEAGEARVDIVV